MMIRHSGLLFWLPCRWTFTLTLPWHRYFIGDSSVAHLLQPIQNKD